MHGKNIQLLAIARERNMVKLETRIYSVLEDLIKGQIGSKHKGHEQNSWDCSALIIPESISAFASDD